MQFTLGQACAALGAYAHDHSSADLVAAINEAVLSLSAYDSWAKLRKVMRLQVRGPLFSLPQDAASVVRACVNGVPSTVLGREFRFLSSGPGDLASLPAGYEYLDPGVVDLGTYPTMFELPGPSRLVAYVSDSVTGAQPALVVTGHAPTGELQTVRLSPAPRATILADKSAYVPAAVFGDIVSVSLAGTPSSYVYLYAAPDADTLWGAGDAGRLVGSYHPAVKAPEFHRYLIPGASADKTYDVLCEVRVNPLPLVEESDVLPFPTLEPVKYALMSNRYLALGEIDAGVKYRELAAQSFLAAEVSEERKQTFTVENRLYPNSLGEMSQDYSFL